MRYLSIPVTAIAVAVKTWETWRDQRHAATTAHQQAIQEEAIARCARGLRDSWHDDNDDDCGWCD